MRIEKQRIVPGYPNYFGLHVYPERRILMSESKWGSKNSRVSIQPRSWLVLHEFSHIFFKDRVKAVCGSEWHDYLSYNIAQQLFIDQERPIGPTMYSSFGKVGAAGSEYFGQEFFTEAVTGTLWNHGWNAVEGYTSDAAGWSASPGNRTYLGLEDFPVLNERGQIVEFVGVWINIPESSLIGWFEREERNRVRDLAVLSNVRDIEAQNGQEPQTDLENWIIGQLMEPTCGTQ